MQSGCAVAIMLETARPRLDGFEVRLRLSKAFKCMTELIFEALPLEAAIHFSEYVVAAISVGADTRSIGWKIMQRTLSDHERADHRVVKATIRQTLDVIAPLAAGETVDIVDAREMMDASNKTLTRALKAVGSQDHPIWDVTLIANETLEAAGTMCRRTADNIVARAVRKSIRTPEDAKSAVRLMAGVLLSLPTNLRHGPGVEASHPSISVETAFLPTTAGR